MKFQTLLDLKMSWNDICFIFEFDKVRAGPAMNHKVFKKVSFLGWLVET